MLTGSSGGQLALTIGPVSTTTIGSQIVDNGVPTALVISGSRRLRPSTISNGNNSYSGGFYLNGGRLLQRPSPAVRLWARAGSTSAISWPRTVAAAGLLRGRQQLSRAALLQWPNGSNNITATSETITAKPLGLSSVRQPNATFNGTFGTRSQRPCHVLSVGRRHRDLGSRSNVGNFNAIGSLAPMPAPCSWAMGIRNRIKRSNRNIVIVAAAERMWSWGTTLGLTTRLSTADSGQSRRFDRHRQHQRWRGTVVNPRRANTRGVGGTVNFILPSGPQSHQRHHDQHGSIPMASSAATPRSAARIGPPTRPISRVAISSGSPLRHQRLYQ